MSIDKNKAAELSEFIQLLTDHQSMMRGYIRLLIPNSSDIRDVLQNTNLVLWERREDFESGTNFKAWAFSIARYRALEHRQKMKKDHLLIFDDQLIDLLDETSIEADTNLLELQQNALTACLAKLKSRDRNLIEARYTHKTPLSEYAKVDGRSHGSLRVILNRLRSVLHDCIERSTAIAGGAR